ncbi:MAG: hypothetical protein HQL67_08255 [Magnetococcales bacterium]|nr:hypothetical protein [Magnetococcales bacterium]
MPYFMPQSRFSDLAVTLASIHLEEKSPLNKAAAQVLQRDRHSYIDEGIQDPLIQAATWILQVAKNHSTNSIEHLTYEIESCSQKAQEAGTLSQEAFGLQQILLERIKTQLDEEHFFRDGTTYALRTFHDLIIHYRPDGQKRARIFGLISNPHSEKERHYRPYRLLVFQKEMTAYYQLGVHLGKFTAHE